MSDLSHPLNQGTWIRTRVLASDSGDFSDREAPAGSLGRIESVEGGSYGIVFWPSFVQNTWDFAEVDADAEVLPDGHPDIPSEAVYDLPSAVADILAEGDFDDAEGTVSASADVASRILAGAALAGVNEAAIRGLVPASSAREGLSLATKDFNRLAALVGIGERLPTEPFPAP
jgi:hypothetical protein